MNTVYKSGVILYHTPAVDGDNIWLSSINKDEVYRFNFTNQEYEFFGSLYNNVECNVLHSRVIRSNNRLIFVPFNAKIITIYDINLHKKFNIDLKRVRQGMGSLFYNAISDEEEVFLIPCRYGMCLGINIDNYEIKEYDFSEENINEKYDFNSHPPILKGACLCGREMAFGLNNCDRLLLKNLDTGEIIEKNIPYTLNGISNIERVKNEIWIIGKNGSIINYDQKEEIFRVSDKLEGYENFSKGHYGVIFETLFMDRKIYMTHTYNAYISVLDVDSGKIESIKLDTYMDNSLSSYPMHFPALYNLEKKIYILDGITGKTFCVSHLNNRDIQILPAVTKDDIIYSESLDNMGMMHEEKNLTLEKFVKYISK